MLRKFLVTSAAIGLTASAAYGADIEAAPMAYDWSGAYIGAQLGYGEADVDYEFASFDEGFFNESRGTHFSDKLDGLIGGGQIGFNWQSDNLVLGLEGAFTWLGFDKSTTSPFFSTDEFKTKVDWSAVITPRVGFAFDNALFYAKGGVAFADIKARIQDNGAELFVEKKKTQVGWTIGGGIEYALTENWIIGAEGNYYDFGSFDAAENTRTFEGEPTGSFSDHDVDTDMWSVLARISYKL